MLKNILKRFDWHFSWEQIVQLMLLMAIYPLMKYADPQWFVENGIVENMQIFILFLMLLLCLKAQNARKMFVFFALIVVFLIMRETNLGRSYFCAKYLKPEEICRWRNLKYGYIIEASKVIYILFTIGYFIVNKIWQPIMAYVKNAPFFVWEAIFFMIGAVGGTIAEFQSIDNEIMEESCEALMYIAMLFALYRYQKIVVGTHHLT